MLWVDKYRPKKLSELSFNDELTKKLSKICNKDIPHMIFGGPDGCGKHTRILACLSEIYGPSVFKTKIQHRQYKLPSKKLIEITTIASNHHIEIDLSEGKQGNKVIIQEIVDEITGGNGCIMRTALKIIVLRHAEQLNIPTQHSLRKTIEKYSSTCRFVLSTNSFSKIIDQLHSRAYAIRVRAPSDEDVTKCLKVIASKENIILGDNVCHQITAVSNNNLGKAIMTMQKLQHTSDQSLLEDWEAYSIKLVNELLGSQRTTSVIKGRENIYELMGKCIEPCDIFKLIVVEILKRTDNIIKKDIIHWASHYEHYMNLGGKPIIHIEAFIVKTMEIYKKFLCENETDDVNDFEEL